ncbi:MAG: pilus assembly protein [Magnetovibrio sp.]|nr:pilus assembly protein [Magnetovibrio sp.]
MKQKRRPISHFLNVFRRNERGSSAIELAMISSILAIILLNIVDIAIFMFHKMDITSAVRAGTQYALVDTQNSTPALITAVVQDSSNLLNVNVTVNDTMCGCSDGGTLFSCGTNTCAGETTGRTQHYTQISADYTHTWLFYPGTISITANSTIRTQ